MKGVLIWLPVLVTLCQTDDDDEHLYLRTGEKTGNSLHDAVNGFIEDYLENKSARNKLDVEIAKSKAKTIARERKSNYRLNDDRFVNEDVGPDKPLRWSYQLDPVLNVKRRADKKSTSDELSSSRSSSREFNDWKEEWREMWKKKKAETKNFTTRIDGDYVNMVAARPWGISCGDPAQHDMPWGSCVLAVECNSEYRIYKGDYFCGRTQFVCCSINFHTYDLYQGLDASFAQSSMELDSAEERAKKKDTSKKKRKRRESRTKRRKSLREERKRKIKRTIAKIIREVQKVLEKSYRNTSRIRKRKTRNMKKFIKYLKKQFRLDRESAKEIHEQQMVEVDQEFLDKLMQIQVLNKAFMNNETIRNIIVNRTMSLRTAKWLAESYPELEGYLPTEMDYTRQGNESSRRIGDYRLRGDSGGRSRYSGRPRGNLARHKGHARIKKGNSHLRKGIARPWNHRKYLNYDVEYGFI